MGICDIYVQLFSQDSLFPSSLRIFRKCSSGIYFEWSLLNLRSWYDFMFLELTERHCDFASKNSQLCEVLSIPAEAVWLIHCPATHFVRRLAWFRLRVFLYSDSREDLRSFAGRCSPRDSARSSRARTRNSARRSRYHPKQLFRYGRVSTRTFMLYVIERRLCGGIWFDAKSSSLELSCWSKHMLTM